MDDKQLLIGGKWIDAERSARLPVINPSDGRSMGTLARGDSVDVDKAVDAAQSAFDGAWGEKTALERGRLLAKLGHLILKHQEELTTIESRDVGKPLSQARNDVVASARYCEFYSGAVDKIHGQTIPYQNGYTVFTLREPHGVTAHIIPWNYPLQIIGRSVIGSLTMGNCVIVKPGEDASLSALFLGNLIKEAGFPDGVVNIVTGYGSEAGAALASHPGIHHISFTGSVGVGALIQKAAADNTVPVTLELGGKSPQLVFNDATLEEALPFIVNASIQNAAQTCSAGSRVLLESGVYDTFLEKLIHRFNQLRVGPAEQDFDLGPLINQRQWRRVKTYADQAEKLTILARGKIIETAPKEGYYAVPLLVGDVPPDHCLAREEIFGPILSVMKFDGEEEAIQLANKSNFGLVAGVWTRDGARQLRVAKRLNVGQVFVNNYGAGGGVELPFGGVKGSGFGREKGLEALYSFSTLKTVAIRHG